MRDGLSKQGRSREPTPGENKKQKNKKYSLSLYTQVLPSKADIKAALPLPCCHRKAIPRNCFCSFLGDPGSSWQWGRAMKTSHGNWFGVVNVQLVSEGKRSCPMTVRFWTVVVVIQNACKIWQFGHCRILGLPNFFLSSLVKDGLCSVYMRVTDSGECCSNFSTEAPTVKMTPTWWSWRHSLKQPLQYQFLLNLVFHLKIGVYFISLTL